MSRHVGIAGKVFKVRDQRSRSYVYQCYNDGVTCFNGMALRFTCYFMKVRKEILTIKILMDSMYFEYCSK